MRFINLTPHELVVFVDGKEFARFPSEGVARAATLTEPAGALDGIPVVRQTFGPVSGLPAPTPGVTYIVSMLVAQHPDVRGRDDVVAPNTSQAVRDASGNIIGVPGFTRYQ
jgi:hypothetical protein